MSEKKSGSFRGKLAQQVTSLGLAATLLTGAGCSKGENHTGDAKAPPKIAAKAEHVSVQFDLETEIANGTLSKVDSDQFGTLGMFKGGEDKAYGALKTAIDSGKPEELAKFLGENWGKNKDLTPTVVAKGAAYLASRDAQTYYGEPKADFPPKERMFEALLWKVPFTRNTNALNYITYTQDPKDGDAVTTKSLFGIVRDGYEVEVGNATGFGGDPKMAARLEAYGRMLTTREHTAAKPAPVPAR